ncbi:MAG: DUF58 domain-containing protein [Planctomycetota bacterium]
MSAERDFLDSKTLARLAGLPLDARMPMLGNVSGRHRSPHRGSSLEFAEYRKYVPGDDTRRLDWRAYARSDRFYIKEYEADTNLRMCLVIDSSGSMNYGKDKKNNKLNYAKKLAGHLAYIASGQGDAVGLYCAGEKFSLEIPPKRNARHLRVVLDELGKLEATGETGLPSALHEAAERIQGRALMVIISDLFMQPEVLSSCFQHLRFRKHDVAVFQLIEPDEIQFDFDRPMRFVDLEGNTSILADPSLIAGQYRTAVKEYMAGLKDAVRDANVDFHRVSISEDPGDVLAKFLLARAPKKKS